MSERNLFWFEACDINAHINPITLFSVHVNNQSEWIQSDWTTNCFRNRKTIMWRFDLFYHGFCPSFICYLPFSFFQFREWVHIYSLEWSEPALVWGELSCTVSLDRFWLLSSPVMQTSVHILVKTWDSDWSSRKLYLSPVRMWTSTCLHSRMVTARLLWGSSMRASTSERVCQRKITVTQRTAESGRWPHDSATGQTATGTTRAPETRSAAWGCTHFRRVRIQQIYSAGFALGIIELFKHLLKIDLFWIPTVSERKQEIVRSLKTWYPGLKM